MKPTLKIDIDELKAYRKNHTVEECAKHYNVSVSTIEKRLSNRKNKPLGLLPSVNTDVNMFDFAKPGSIDPNTALFFTTQEKNRIQAELQRTHAEAEKAKENVEKLKEEKLKLEREVENLTKELNNKPNALGGLMDGIGEGLKADPAGMITAFFQGISHLKSSNAEPQQPMLGAQMQTVFADASPQAQQFLKVLNNMLVNESKVNPVRFQQLVNALVELTKPENQPILIQLQPPQS